MSTRPIKALGEIALRVNDLDRMQKFYTSILGLELMQRFQEAAFFKVAEGYGGHTQILALFDRSNKPDYTGLSAAQTTIDHLAFTISLSDYEAEKERLEGLGIKITTAEHKWVHWRSLYFFDPEGNQVELVCFDESVS